MFRRFFSGILFFVFVFLIQPFFLIFIFSQTYLSPDFYEGPFVEKFSEEFPHIVAEQTQDLAQKESLSLDLAVLTDMIRAHFTKDVFRDFIHDLVEQFQLLHRSRPFLLIDFSFFRSPLENFFSDFLFYVFEQIPACAEGQTFYLNGLPSCVPPEWKKPSFRERFRHEFDRIASSNFFRNFSNSAFFKGPIEVSFENNIQEILFFRSIISKIPILFFGFLFIFIILIFFIRGRPFEKSFFFIGRMFVISAIIGFLFSAFIHFSPLLLNEQSLPPDLTSFSGTIRSILSFLISFFFHRYFLYNVLLFIIGIVLIARSHFFPLQNHTHVT